MKAWFFDAVCITVMILKRVETSNKNTVTKSGFRKTRGDDVYARRFTKTTWLLSKLPTIVPWFTWKKSDITRCHHWFTREMTSEKRAPKFPSDDTSLPRSGYCFWLVLPRGGNLLQPIISSTQIYVVKRHQHLISALFSQTSFRWETKGGVPKCQLFFRLAHGVLEP